MKKSLTFIFLWFAFLLAAQPQTGTIKVNVEDGCGNAFDKPVTIDLYQVIGNNATLITSSNSHPAVFDNLDQGYTYEVRMASSDVTDTDVSIKDAVVMRYNILGVYNYLNHLPGIFASDANGNFGISTLDLVFLMRHLVKIPDQNVSYKEWFFIDQNHLNSQDFSLKNRTIVQGIPNGLKEITFNGYQHGAAESTVAAFCTFCAEDSTSTKVVQIPTISVTAGQEVKFVLGYNFSAQDVGASFSLKYRDGSVSTVSAVAGTITNLVASTASINVARVFDQNTPSYLEFAQITFTPTKSGKLSDFFSLNDQYKNELVYKDGNCLKTYQKLSINNINPCPVTWPADTTIPDCTSNHYAGSPIIDLACINIVTVAYSDQVFGTPCTKILRKWTAINWVTSEIYNHTQIITIDANQSLNCIGNVTVLVPDSAIIWAVDMVRNININHQYSFSATDPTKTSLVLYNIPPYAFDVMVYDLTDSTSCITSVNIVNNGCIDPVNTISEIIVNETNGVYIVNGSMFDAGNVNHCLGSISNFEIKPLQSTDYVEQLSFDYNLYKGTQLKVALRYKINGIFVNHGQVNIIFQNGPALPPFEIVCYDDPVVKNELFEVAFFSSTFENIYGLQAAIRLKDAIMVSTKKKALADISFNEELRSLRFVWLLPTAAPLTLSGTDTLFTMTIRPTVTGSLSDILSIAEDLMKSEAILNDFEQTKVDLVFRFLRRTTATQDLTMDDISIFPNPTSTGIFTIQSNGLSNGTVSVYNESGQEVLTTQIDGVDGSYQLSLPEYIKNGVYLVRLTNEKAVFTKKIILMK
jgi:hypothetical protein